MDYEKNVIIMTLYWHSS